MALEIIEREGAGILVYLRQEGRGIGLAPRLLSGCRQGTGQQQYDGRDEEVSQVT